MGALQPNGMIEDVLESWLVH